MMQPTPCHAAHSVHPGRRDGSRHHGRGRRAEPRRSLSAWLSLSSCGPPNRSSSDRSRRRVMKTGAPRRYPEPSSCCSDGPPCPPARGRSVWSRCRVEFAARRRLRIRQHPAATSLARQLRAPRGRLARGRVVHRIREVRARCDQLGIIHRRKVSTCRQRAGVDASARTTGRPSWHGAHAGHFGRPSQQHDRRTTATSIALRFRPRATPRQQD